MGINPRRTGDGNISKSHLIYAYMLIAFEIGNGHMRFGRILIKEKCYMDRNICKQKMKLSLSNTNNRIICNVCKWHCKWIQFHPF